MKLSKIVILACKNGQIKQLADEIGYDAFAENMSTKALEVACKFNPGSYQLPSCYYNNMDIFAKTFNPYDDSLICYLCKIHASKVEELVQVLNKDCLEKYMSAKAFVNAFVQNITMQMLVDNISLECLKRSISSELFLNYALTEDKIQILENIVNPEYLTQYISYKTLDSELVSNIEMQYGVMQKTLVYLNEKNELDISNINSIYHIRKLIEHPNVEEIAQATCVNILESIDKKLTESIENGAIWTNLSQFTDYLIIYHPDIKINITTIFDDAIFHMNSELFEDIITCLTKQEENLTNQSTIISTLVNFKVGPISKWCTKYLNQYPAKIFNCSEETYLNIKEKLKDSNLLEEGLANEIITMQFQEDVNEIHAIDHQFNDHTSQVSGCCELF
ncbi:MAG: hypothetical protein AB8B67_04290 [Rickettsiaceae bacterium]